MIKPMCRHPLAGLRDGSSVRETLHLKYGSSLLYCTCSLPSSREKASIPNLSAAIDSLWLFIYAMAIARALSHRRGFYVRAGAWVRYCHQISLKDFANTEALVLDCRGARVCKIVATLLLEYVFPMGSNAISDFRNNPFLPFLFCSSVVDHGPSILGQHP